MKGYHITLTVCLPPVSFEQIKLDATISFIHIELYLCTILLCEEKQNNVFTLTAN